MIRNAADNTRVKILLVGKYSQSRAGTIEFDYDSEQNHLGTIDGRLGIGLYLVKLDAPNTGTMAAHAKYLERVEDEVQEAEVNHDRPTAKC